MFPSFRERRVGAVCGSGGDLLSHALRRSTIGAAGLNGRVREGIGCFPRAVTAGPAGRAHGGASAGVSVWKARLRVFPRFRTPSRRVGRVGGVSAGRLPGRDQAYRAISTGRLSASPRLHLRPIDVVVFHGSRARPGFEGGFPLRCLQRLSRPHIATLHRGWRHDCSTSGASTPVLSY